MIINLQKFKTHHASDLQFKLGCVVDTNILFGAAYPSDRLNTWAEKFFEGCHANQIPVYTNINIRSEFMDLYRKVLIVESLLELRSKYREDLTPDLEKRLKALDQRVRSNIEKNISTQLSERDFKEYRKTLLEIFPKKSESGLDLWQILCRDFVEPQLKNVWENTTELLGINFAGSRVTDSPELFNQPPSWDGATAVMGQSAMGSADAMIVNFFLCSKFSLLVTADAQVAAYVESVSPDRVIVVPDDEELV